mgnify:FL=1
MKKLIAVLSLMFLLFDSRAQTDMSAPKRFDYGKMWTFEYPPKDWFKEAYNFTADDKWFEGVRMSALRFASWCSASFVSPNGLIMTNHHCSRDVVGALQKEGENFDKNGFYAATLADERRAKDLFVEQLVKVEDITERMLKIMDKASDDVQRKQFQDSAMMMITKEYNGKSEWKGLRIQPVTYYSGGKFSL